MKVTLKPQHETLGDIVANWTRICWKCELPFKGKMGQVVCTRCCPPKPAWGERTPVYVPYQPRKRIALYCRQRARDAACDFARERWLRLFHAAYEADR